MNKINLYIIQTHITIRSKQSTGLVGFKIASKVTFLIYAHSSKFKFEEKCKLISNQI